MIVEDFTMDVPKTKEFIAIVKDLKLEGKKMLFVLPENNRAIYLSARNLSQTRSTLPAPPSASPRSCPCRSRSGRGRPERRHDP